MSIKRSTNIVGLAVVPNAREVLLNMYQQTLEVLDRMPPEAVYKTSSQQIVEKRIDSINTMQDVKELEAAIGQGQAEELIEQAERELSLALQMEQWQPWEGSPEPIPESQWSWPL